MENDRDLEAVPDSAPFDFAAHGAEAAAQYRNERGFYVEFAEAVRGIITECLRLPDVRIHRVDARAKTIESFQAKASSPSDYDPEVPKYQDPLHEITDLAGVRIIAFLPSALPVIDTMMAEEFVVIERSDKAASLIEEGRFGYQSIHYLLSLGEGRTRLGEYQRFKDAIVEVQIRTILQHAWAEIEHDIQYKSAEAIPGTIRRRFMTLAGLLELADREFQAIQDEDSRLKSEARQRVEAGNLENLELTPDSVKAYLDHRVGPDGRMSDFSYDWITRVLKTLGFHNLDQVENAIAPYDFEQVTRSAHATRPGQITRFESLLLAAMGDRFIERHPYCEEDWYRATTEAALEKLRGATIVIGDYDPMVDL